MKTRLNGVALALLLAGSAAMAGAQESVTELARSEPARKLEIPDEQLVDQDGRPVRLYSDLMKGRVVAVNFVFTTCSTICSPMTAVFSRLQKELGERLGKDVYLISITLDPAADTPERLARYAGKFDRREGWTFVTGPAERVKRALTALGGAVATKESHTPVVLLGNEATGEWTRAYGLSAPTRLAGQLEALLSKNPPSTPKAASRTERLPITGGPEADAAAARYFTDTELVDQDGKPRRFYSDLIRGKTVLINFAFASCKTACSPITANLARVQRLLGPRLGKDIHMITITVDPLNDTPAKLKAFSQRFQASPGWYFLSGSRANVEAVLKKVGGYTEEPEKHLTSVIIGDSVTGTWLRALAMAPPENLAYAVEHLNDETH